MFRQVFGAYYRGEVIEPFLHRAEIEPDDGTPVTFRWHWPRGTFTPRMSAYEMAGFVLPHMPSVAPLLSNHPRIRAEFDAMMVLLATSPRSAIDRLLPWIKSVTRADEDDILEMSLFAHYEHPLATTYSFGGTKFPS